MLLEFGCDKGDSEEMRCKWIVLLILIASFAPAQAQQTMIHGGAPVVSPNGLHIAFLSDRTGTDELFVISTDGTGERQLTTTPEEKSSLAWTRDGKQVLFSDFANDISHLYAINLSSVNSDGPKQREIAKVPGRGPTLAPDGNRLLYMTGTWTATRLMMGAPDGSKPQSITDGSFIAWNNHWSPDGRRIAFTSRNDPKAELAIFFMNADGSERRQLSHFAAGSGNAQWPVWSSDGHQLAIQVNRSQGHSADIWILDATTGDGRKLAAHEQPYLDETPSWFPDGKRIAFQSNRTGKIEVWVMNADGSGARQITR
jgi:Tol biopolymer transport system component